VVSFSFDGVCFLFWFFPQLLFPLFPPDHTLLSGPGIDYEGLKVAPAEGFWFTSKLFGFFLRQSTSFPPSTTPLPRRRRFFSPTGPVFSKTPFYLACECFPRWSVRPFSVEVGHGSGPCRVSLDFLGPLLLIVSKGKVTVLLSFS